MNFSFIGGSLLEIGGHNPFEAIKLGCSVISGRGVFNFKDIYTNLEAEKSCIMIDSGNDLGAAAEKLLRDENACKAMNEKAFELIKNSDNFAGKVVAKMNEIS